ncbi:hypothetical protein DITRI_Ditri19aG0133600 [Diplodiscus trichospermus]
MMLKFLGWFIFFLCATALSCRNVEGFPTLESQDFNISAPVLQGREIHVLRHAGLNRTVSLNAKGSKEEYEKHHKVFLSRKSTSGKGTHGGSNIGRRSPQAKNAASSRVGPSFVLSNAVILTVILPFPSLLLNLF